MKHVLPRFTKPVAPGRSRAPGGFASPSPSDSKDPDRFLGFASDAAALRGSAAADADESADDDFLRPSLPSPRIDDAWRRAPPLGASASSSSAAASPGGGASPSAAFFFAASSTRAPGGACVELKASTILQC